YRLPILTIITQRTPKSTLFPYTTLFRSENITGEKITDEEDMKEAAEQIVTKHGAQSALVKGGHLQGDAVDFLYDGNKIHTFKMRSEEHTSELQSRFDLVCRLLLEKKKN